MRRLAARDAAAATATVGIAPPTPHRVISPADDNGHGANNDWSSANILVLVEVNRRRGAYSRAALRLGLSPLLTEK